MNKVAHAVAVLAILAAGGSAQAAGSLLALRLAAPAVPPHSRARLERVALAAAASTLPSRLVVRAATLSSVPTVSFAPVSAVVEWKRNPAPGAQSALVSFVQDGQTVARTWARITVARERRVYVAKESLPAGMALADAALEVAWRDVPEATPPAAIGLVHGGRLIRPVAAAAVVFEADVAAPPPIGRGTRVAVVVKKGAVVVEGAGKLEHDARLGDETQVRLENGKLVGGMLVDPTTVEVALGAPGGQP